MTRDRSNDKLVQPGVFLDRGILISLFQFWDACRSANAADRLREVTRLTDLEKALESAGVTIDGRVRDDSINRGINAFKRLDASSSTCIYYSSHACWAELHHTLLEARGLEGLMRNGVPQSLRVRRPQRLYRFALQESDYDELRGWIKQFRDSMKLDYGIDVIDVEDPSRRLNVISSEIWDGAREVWSRVLLDVLDAYVCAAAILVGVDILVSDDGALRDALEILNHPDRDRNMLKEALGMAHDAPFPEPRTPRAALP